MNARDIMTSPVISIAPDATVREIAALLLERRISALPVLDAGQLVGIVSEADLLHRHEIGTEAAHRPWWLSLVASDMALADYIKSHARRARDIMSARVVSVEDAAPVAAVAAVLERHRVRRVPVLRGRRLVGIISRADLVRALAGRARPARRGARKDADMRLELLDELQRQPWWRGAPISVVVSDGVVHYSGTIEAEAERDAARIAAENVPGVRGVDDRRIALQDMPVMV